METRCRTKNSDRQCRFFCSLPFLGRLAFSISKLWVFHFNLALIGLLGENKPSWVLSFAFVIEAGTIGPFPRSMVSQIKIKQHFLRVTHFSQWMACHGRKSDLILMLWDTMLEERWCINMTWRSKIRLIMSVLLLLLKTTFVLWLFSSRKRKINAVRLQAK